MTFRILIKSSAILSADSLPFHMDRMVASDVIRGDFSIQTCMKRGIDMTLEEIVQELYDTGEIGQMLLHKIRKDETFLAEVAETAYHGDNFDFPLCRRMPFTRLAVVTYLLLQKYQDYQAIGTPQDIILDTFRDVALRANLYYEKHGKPGLTKEDVIWFRHIMGVGIFKIGVLQFQPFEMIYLDEETLGQPYMTFTKEQKDMLPPGTPVLNCHIQHGTDLSPPSVTASLEGATRFFSQRFSNVSYQAFLCYSWLLYPPMLAQLSEHSNIKHFARRFSILGFCQDPEQAAEHLFEHGTSTRLPPHATSLQRLAVDHFQLFGMACGIIPLSFKSAVHP